jgi:hypothetical protein
MAHFFSYIERRKKEKQHPPGSSSRPASQLPTLIPSAADGLSKADLAVATPGNVPNQQGNTSSYRSVAKATALNAFKLTLTTLGKASDNIPVPGLKLAMEGLLLVIEKVQVRL